MNVRLPSGEPIPVLVITYDSGENSNDRTKMRAMAEKICCDNCRYDTPTALCNHPLWGTAEFDMMNQNQCFTRAGKE